MEFFDFITQDEVDALPHDDPRAAFVEFTRIAHRRLGQRLSELDTFQNDDSTWRLSNDAKRGFINVVIAVAKKYGIEPFSLMEVPKVKGFDPDDHAQMRSDLDHYVTQLALDNSSRSQRDSVFITAELKSNIQKYLNPLREVVQNASDLEPSRKAILLRRLDEFEIELSKKRLSLSAVALLMITLASAPGGVWASVEIANKLVTQIIKVVGDAKEVDDATRRLPAVEPLSLSPPRKADPQPPKVAIPASRGRRGDMDDEIPF